MRTKTYSSQFVNVKEECSAVTKADERRNVSANSRQRLTLDRTRQRSIFKTGGLKTSARRTRVNQIIVPDGTLAWRHVLGYTNMAAFSTVRNDCTPAGCRAQYC